LEFLVTSRKSSVSTGSRARKVTRKASRVDRHELYERSVQNTDHEFDFLDAEFRRLRGRVAHLLREDFCGTAQMSCEWVRRRRNNRAVGVDIDPAVLQWSREHNLPKLTPSARSRVQLVQSDVRDNPATAVDIVIAMNFSYQIFATREALRGYFAQVRKGLVDDGVFFIDAFGGYDAFREMRERTEHRGFTYIWDQARYDPITGKMLCHIHFAFPDGSRLNKAFSYEWRLWTLPELQELLNEAGYSKVTVYWQGTDRNGEPDGVFKPATEGEADPAWIAFLSAQK
jgi:SAM-dependent methyltransferase